MSDTLPPYPAYKESGVPWLGEIPMHWEVIPGLAAYRLNQRKNTGMAEKTVLSLSYGRVIVKPPEKLYGLVPASFETYQIVDPGNIIIRPTDLQNDHMSLRVGQAKNRGIITSAYLCLQSTELLCADYAYYVLDAYDLMKIFYGMGSGLRQNLDFSDLRRMPVLLPPKSEQAAIVRYLDHADRQIRRFIRAKRRTIELLNEQKQAIIHQAVTRGLDPNVPLKPSGVEWLGDVPAHWEVMKLKYLFKEIDERSKTGEEILLSLRMYKGLVPHTEVSNVPITSDALIGFKITRPNQIVMNRMRAALGMFGLTYQTGIVSPDYAIFQATSSVEPNYYVQLFKTSTMRAVFMQESKGLGTGSAGFLRLYSDRFGAIPVPVPSSHEQKIILEYLQSATNKLEASIEKIEHEVRLIREYRTSLIADVVTGKVDVRAAAQQLPDDVDDAELWDEAISDDDDDLAEVEEASPDDDD